MNRTRVRRPEPAEVPRPLPRGMLAELLGRGRLLLCLDYDGTLAEIVSDPSRAVPLAPAGDAVAALARRPDKIAVAIVSGREIEVVRSLLGLGDGIMFAGRHGLDFIGRDGRRQSASGVEQCLPDIEEVRRFLARVVPRNRGFIVEDKGLAITLNYRSADPSEARDLLGRLERFVTQQTPHLKAMCGKMVLEALPSGIGGKAEAVRFFVSEMGEPRPAIAYFGDDTTDEDAFWTLRGDGGLTVLVGPERPSFASYRVDGPSDVARLLADLATRLQGLADVRAKRRD